MRSTTRQQAGCDHLLDRGDPREQAAMVLDKLTRQERILERILERQDRQERFLERIMDRLLDEPGPPEPFEWTDDADEEPQTQTAGGGDDPPAGDWPAGVDESHRISPSCLGVLVGASLARNALRAAGRQLDTEGTPNAQTVLRR